MTVLIAFRNAWKNSNPSDTLLQVCISSRLILGISSSRVMKIHALSLLFSFLPLGQVFLSLNIMCHDLRVGCKVLHGGGGGQGGQGRQFFEQLKEVGF